MADLTTHVHRTSQQLHRLRYRPNAGRFWSAILLSIFGYAINLAAVLMFDRQSVSTVVLTLMAGFAVLLLASLVIDNRLKTVRLSYPKLTFLLVGYIAIGLVASYLKVNGITHIGQLRLSDLANIFAVLFIALFHLTIAISGSIVEKDPNEQLLSKDHGRLN